MSNSFCIIYCSRKVVRAEVVQKKLKNADTNADTIFKTPEIVGFRPYTETQKSHRTWGGDCHPLFV